jgi:ankyrin repeat protein
LVNDDRNNRALPNAESSSALLFAVRGGHTEIVQLLLSDNREQRALPDEQNSAVLEAAVLYDRIEIVRLLLDDNRDHRALPDALSSKALELAVAIGNAPIVELLLSDTRDHRVLPSYETLLSTARRGHENVCRLLLEGHNYNNNDVRHALQTATLQKGSAAVAQLLRKHLQENGDDHSLDFY